MMTAVSIEQLNDRLAEAIEAMNEINQTLRELNNIIRYKER